MKNDELRKKAQEIIQQRGILDSTEYNKSLEELVEELQIYQVELEHQNDELRRVSEELNESREKYIDLYENSPSGYATINQEHDIVQINSSLCKLLQIDIFEATKNKLTKFIHPGSQDRFYFFAKECFASRGIKLSTPLTLKGKNKALHVQVEAIAVPDGSPPGNYIRLSVVDLTEERKKEKELAREKEIWQKSFKNINEGLCIVLEDFTILQANEAFAKIVAKPLEKIIGAKSHELLHGQAKPDNCHTCRALINKIESHKEYHEPYLEKYLEIRVDQVFKKNKEFDFSILTVRDVTEKTRLVQLYKQTNTIINRSPAVAFQWKNEAGWPVAFVSENVEKVLGYSVNDFLEGRVKFEEIVHPVDLNRVIKEVEENSLDTNTNSFQHEPYRLKKKNGEYIWVDDHTFINYGQQNISSYEGIITDITERMETRQQLETSNQMLEMFFQQPLDGFFFMMLDEPVKWDETVDKEKTMDYVFAHHRITKVNQEMLNQYEVKEDDFVGLVPNDLFAHDLPYWRKIWMDFFSKGKLYIDTKEKKSDGSDMWVEGNYICLYDEQKRITGHFGIQRDITRRKKAEQELQFHSNLLNQIQDLVTATDLEGNITYVNDAECRMQGKKAEEIIGQNVAMYGEDPMEGTTQREIIEATREKGEWRGEVINILKGGKKVILDCRTRLIHDEKGQPIGMIGVSTDITRQKETEKNLKEKNEEYASLNEEYLAQNEELQAAFNELNDKAAQLKDSEERFRSYVENASELIVATDLEGNFTYTSPNLKEILGYDPSLMIGKNVQDFTHPEDNERCQEFFKNIIQSEQKDKGIEYRVKHANGSWRWHTTSAAPIRDNFGKVKAYLGIAHDITEKKEAEQKAEKFTRDLQVISEVSTSLNKASLQDEVFSILGQKITELNPGAFVIISCADLEEPGTVFIKKYYGFKGLVDKVIQSLGKDPRKMAFRVEEMSEKQIAQFTAGKFERIEEGIYSLMNQKMPANICKTFEKIFHIHSVYSMGYAHEGSPLGGVTILCRDKEGLKDKNLMETLVKQTSLVLSQVRAKEELVIAKDKAEESDRLKSAFLTNMSHEIRTPMNGILGFAHLLKKPALSGEKQKQYIKVIEQSGQRMLNIINDLIDISKIESGQIDLRMEETDINDQLDSLCTFFQPEAETKNIKLKCSRKMPEKERVIFTDKSKINQVLSNLLKNALKYTHEGEIEFGCNKENDRVKYFVRDTGIGIAEKEKEKIFERFRQAEYNLNKSYEGAGLGLSISKAYIEMLGGRIWVDSVVGKGSTFYFTLPLERG